MIEGSQDVLLLLQMKISQFLNQFRDGECEDGIILCVPENIDKLMIDYLCEESDD